MLRGMIIKALFTCGWDTCRRNTDVATILRSILRPGQSLLDVGSGDYGIRDFINMADVTSVDINRPHWRENDPTFVQASITSLPFVDQSFTAVLSLDVIEHMSPEARNLATKELVRVAGKSLIIAFPSGSRSEQLDKSFRDELNKRHKEQPGWLIEHLQYSYPSVDSVVLQVKEEALLRERQVDTAVAYSEPIWVTKSLRWAASRSSVLYMGLNLLVGALSPLISMPSKDDSYRAIVIVTFDKLQQ